MGESRPSRGISKVPIEGLLRSQGPIRGTSSMLALLALPLLAMSARGQVEDRSLLEDLIEDLEQHQYPDYQQYNDQVYDGEPAPARALHQDDLRAATRQGRQIKSSMLPAYCDPPNPCSFLSLVMTAPLRPMILGWYSGLMSIWISKLFNSLSAFSFSKLMIRALRSSLAFSTLAGAPVTTMILDCSSEEGTLMLTSCKFIRARTPSPFLPIMKRWNSNGASTSMLIGTKAFRA